MELKYLVNNGPLVCPLCCALWIDVLFHDVDERSSIH
jgi:hypothetical protein